MASDAQKQILGIAFIAFVLLGILFGMSVMTFIFGGLEGGTIFPQNSNSTLNETGHINTTLFQVSHAGVIGFDNFVVTSAINTTSGLVIENTNYSVNGDLGTVLGTGFTNWTDVQFNYTFTSGKNAQVISSATTDNSLTAINTYATGANNQFSTLSTIIILLLLITIFAVFWKFFTGGVAKSSTGQSTGSFG